VPIHTCRSQLDGTSARVGKHMPHTHARGGLETNLHSLGGQPNETLAHKTGRGNMGSARYVDMI
jgi:hypothetical protein